MLGMLTWNRSAVFDDAETLYRDVIARNPQAWMAYQNLGTELAGRNRLSEAIDAYEGALRARPDFPQARNNLVLAHMKLGDAAAEVPDRIPSAILHYESVLRIQPDHFRAHYNLGTVLMDLPERHAEAITHLEAAVRMRPESTEAQVNLGVALADIPARSQEAIAHLEIALAKRPDLTRPRTAGAVANRWAVRHANKTEDQKIRRSEIGRSNINRNPGHHLAEYRSGWSNRLHPALSDVTLKFMTHYVSRTHRTDSVLGVFYLYEVRASKKLHTKRASWCAISSMN